MKIVYQNNYYRIYEIPEDEEFIHQYEFFIKENCKAKRPSAQIDRDGYTAFENGLEYAKELAENTIQTYFPILK